MRPSILLILTLTLLQLIDSTVLQSTERSTSSPFSPSCLQPSDPAPAINTTYSLTQELSSWADLSILFELVSQFPDLLQAAESADPLLLFAPTNRAFVSVARALDPEIRSDDTTVIRVLAAALNALSELPDGVGVVDVLLYHVVAGDLPESDIRAAGSLDSLEGTQLSTTNYPLRVEDIDPIFDSMRLGRQIATVNGRISIIDNVLLPLDLNETLSGSIQSTSGSQTDERAPTVEPGEVYIPFRSLLSFITSRNDLVILETLVARSDALVRALAEAEAFHVFAPNNDAFVALLEALIPHFQELALELLEEAKEAVNGGRKGLEMFADRLVDRFNSLQGLPTLEDILRYHVLDTAKSYEDLVGEGRQLTLFGVADIEILANGVKDNDPDREDASRIASFATGNGFMTIIDGVLLPFPFNETVDLITAALSGSDGSESSRPEVSADADEDDDAVCFPAHATVRLEDGTHKRMDKLSAGDSIAVSRDAHSAVFLFTHRLHERVANFVTLETDCNRSVTLTRSHYVYADGRLASAGTVRLGESLETDLGFCQVVKTSKVVRRGLFAPHTMHGDLVVDGVKVSSYSTAVEPRLAHWSLALVRVFVRFGVAEPLQGWFDGGAPRLAAVLPGGYQRY